MAKVHVLSILSSKEEFMSSYFFQKGVPMTKNFFFLLYFYILRTVSEKRSDVFQHNGLSARTNRSLQTAQLKNMGSAVMKSFFYCVWSVIKREFVERDNVEVGSITRVFINEVFTHS